MTPQEVAQAGKIKGLTMRCEKLDEEADKWAAAYRQAKESAQEQQARIDELEAQLAANEAEVEALRELLNDWLQDLPDEDAAKVVDDTEKSLAKTRRNKK